MSAAWWLVNVPAWLLIGFVVGWVLRPRRVRARRPRRCVQCGGSGSVLERRLGAPYWHTCWWCHGRGVR